MEKPISTFVRERRLLLGLTQEQLAERIGGTYSQGDISRIELGRIELPRLSTMVSMAAALEVTVGDILIAAGWFNDGNVIANGQLFSDADPHRFEPVLAQIEIELEAIRDLERQSEYRSRRLREKIRDFKESSGLSVSLIAAD